MPFYVVPDATIPSSAVAAERTVHLEFVDGLRGLAAMYVVLHHAWLQTWPVLLYGDAWTQPCAWWMLAGWMLYGHFAVTFFITLSGFCLMIPVLGNGGLRGGAAVFFRGRARRILPAYYAALLVSVGIAGFVLRPVTHTLYDASLPVTGTGVALHLLLLHNLWRPVRAQINGPLWSVAVECQVYVLFPLLVGLWKRRGMLWVAGVTAGVSGLLYWAERSLGDESLTPQYLFLFGLGMYAAVFAFPRYGLAGRSWFEPSVVQFRIVGWCAGLGLVVSVHMFRLTYMRGEDLLVGMMSACVLVVATREVKSVVRRVASWPGLVWVGSFSYSLYLVHFPLQQWFWQALVEPLHVGKIQSFLLVAVVGTGVLLPVSFLFYRLVEKPFMRAKPSVAGARSEVGKLSSHLPGSVL